MVVPAPESGRFTKAQLEELKLTLGARYGSEMLCQWASQGDSIYDETTMEMAFGTDVDDASMPPPELDPDAAFGHLDLDELFAAQPFAKKPTGIGCTNDRIYHVQSRSWRLARPGRHRGRARLKAGARHQGKGAAPRGEAADHHADPAHRTRPEDDDERAGEGRLHGAGALRRRSSRTTRRSAICWRRRCRGTA